MSFLPQLATHHLFAGNPEDAAISDIRRALHGESGLFTEQATPLTEEIVAGSGETPPAEVVQEVHHKLQSEVVQHQAEAAGGAAEKQATERASDIIAARITHIMRPTTHEAQTA
jgi:hypothetical protein